MLQHQVRQNYDDRKLAGHLLIAANSFWQLMRLANNKLNKTISRHQAACN
jgi:hypothetical protein